MGILRLIIEALGNRKYNKDLEKMGVVDKDEIVSTTIGWKSDNNQIKTEGWQSASGNDEYHTVIRTKKK